MSRFTSTYDAGVEANPDDHQARFDLAQALQDWDTRDRNVNLPATQIKVSYLAMVLLWNKSTQFLFAQQSMSVMGFNSRILCAAVL